MNWHNIYYETNWDQEDASDAAVKGEVFRLMQEERLREPVVLFRRPE